MILNILSSDEMKWKSYFCRGRFLLMWEFCCIFFPGTNVISPLSSLLQALWSHFFFKRWGLPASLPNVPNITHQGFINAFYDTPDNYLFQGKRLSHVFQTWGLSTDAKSLKVVLTITQLGFILKRFLGGCIFHGKFYRIPEKFLFGIMRHWRTIINTSFNCCILTVFIFCASPCEHNKVYCNWVWYHQKKYSQQPIRPKEILHRDLTIQTSTLL